MAGAGGPKPGGANMEFKEMKEGPTTPPTVEYEHIKARRVHVWKIWLLVAFPSTSMCPYFNS